jgi:hypothetical protein
MQLSTADNADKARQSANTAGYCKRALRAFSKWQTLFWFVRRCPRFVGFVGVKIVLWVAPPVVSQGLGCSREKKRWDDNQ